jgi:3-oxoacyl-(acyl-carrier-protein) synthase
VNTPISITAIASVSPLGASLSEAWDAYRLPDHLLVPLRVGGQTCWAGPLPGELQKEICRLGEENNLYAKLDKSVKYALFAARKALGIAEWAKGESFGINIGSSRGATGLFEQYHEEFLREQRTSALSSPTTTLGNISSWVAHDLQARGPDISHSITCSTALHALLNGIAWIRSGMAPKFIVGGSEAPLTPFTIAQMQALKIYTTETAGEKPEYPCRALDLQKPANSMVLGEGASLACLEAGVSDRSLAIVEGIGYATEILEHNVSLSTDARCFQQSMRMALGTLAPEQVDVLVLHAPGTVKGDLAEYRAIEKVFGNKLPALTSNKWKIGHTFGASGMLSIEMAILMLRRQEFIKIPYIADPQVPETIKRVMVNAVGFGGNAVSVLLKAI